MKIYIILIIVILNSYISVCQIQFDYSNNSEKFEIDSITYLIIKNEINTVAVLRNEVKKDTLKIPEFIKYEDVCYTVRYISENVFLWSNKKVYFPNTIKKIGVKCEMKIDFYIERCYNKKSLDILLPDSIEYLNVDYLNSQIINSINVNENNIMFCAINGVLYNKDTTEIILFPNMKKEFSQIPKSVKKIGKYAFSELEFIKKIHIPNTIESIDDFAFKASKINYIYIPDNVKFIGEGVFRACFLLKKIRLPSNLNNISVGLFASCISLRKIKLPQTVKIINSFAFSRCRNLRKISIPNSLIKINETAFSECVKLRNIDELKLYYRN